jgi:glyoxylase-like metal-dependent hydrolase (beta-lactamase superfamily II)
MAETPTPLAFDTGFEPETGKAVAVLAGIDRITAPNASAYTFTGTNSFVIGLTSVAILDPGPDEPRHRAALRAAVGGRRVEAIILTHTHRDHSASAAALKRETGAPLWFAGPHRLSRPARLFEFNALAFSCDWRLVPDRTFYDGERFAVGGIELTAIATPGHCANHICLGIGGTDWLLSGDHIMGWNSTLVAPPDGSMADYLASLRKVIALPYAHYLPAHGGPVANGPAYARAARPSRIAQPAGDRCRGGRRDADEPAARTHLSDPGADAAPGGGVDAQGASRISRGARADPRAADAAGDEAVAGLRAWRSRD